MVVAFRFVKVESCIIPRASDLTSWVRYHDDVVGLFTNRVACKSFFAILKQKAKPMFTVLCDGVFSVGKSFVFLDLHVTVAIPRLLVSVSQVKHLTPLSPASAHAPGVHASWPNAVAKRTHILSGGSSAQHNLLCNRYRNACAHSYTLHLFESWRPKPACASVPATAIDPEVLKVPLVLRYHPCFNFAFNRALMLVPPPREMGCKFVSSWKNALPSLNGVISKVLKKSCNREKDEREGSCFLSGRNLCNYNLRDFQLLPLIRQSAL